MSKYTDTRLVTFKEDFAPARKVIYAKGTTHAIHFKTLEVIKRKGGQFKEDRFSEEFKEKVVTKRKQAKKKAEELAAE
jgi:hypothetical protein